MSDANDRAGIDVFLPIAAFLAAALHTSPLSELSATAELLLVGVPARLAISFFFMTGGYFTITRYARDASGLWSFEKRAAVWYLASALIFLPVNISNGYFADPGWLPELLRDIVFDGFFYHLWFFPAAMAGCAVAYVLVRKLDYPWALAVTGALYLAGLLGDTVAGLEAFFPFNAWLQIMDRTRCGLFFAPLFFVLGGLCRERPSRLGRPALLAGLSLSLALMAGEALGLRALELGKNYDMTLALPVSSLLLFRLLLTFRGKSRRGLGVFALLVYIIHPMSAILIRCAAGPLGLWDILVENNALHFLAVCAVSAAIAVPAGAALRRLAPARPDRARDRAWIELDPEALRQNVSELRAILPNGCRLMGVVKREAYGHGAFETATELERAGVDAFAAATVDEAIALRRYGIRGTILVLGWTDPERARDARRYRLTLTLTDLDSALALDARNVRLTAHLKLDTGMHRLGLPWDDREALKMIAGLKNISVTGVFTHLACSEARDAASEAFTAAQTERFNSALRELSALGIRAGAHIDSTYGLLNYPGFDGAYVRVGLGVYGVLSAPGEHTELTPKLQPVLSLRARVASLRRVPAGEGVGYGLESVSDRDRVLALLPIGYGDGYPRALSNGVGQVLIRGGRAPVAGLVCMDMMLVDVTDIPGVTAGDAAVLIGRDGDDVIRAEALAASAGTITNELLSRLGPRLPVTVKGAYRQ